MYTYRRTAAPRSSVKKSECTKERGKKKNVFPRTLTSTDLRRDDDDDDEWQQCRVWARCGLVGFVYSFPERENILPNVSIIDRFTKTPNVILLWNEQEWALWRPVKDHVRTRLRDEKDFGTESVSTFSHETIRWTSAAPRYVHVYSFGLRITYNNERFRVTVVNEELKYD